MTSMELRERLLDGKVMVIDLLEVAASADALMALHDDPDPEKREAGKHALWNGLRIALDRLGSR